MTDPSGLVDFTEEAINVVTQNLKKLGSSVSKVALENRVDAWVLSSSQCVRAAVQNVEDRLGRLGKKFTSRAEMTLWTEHRPGLDGSTHLKAKEATHYQSLIDVLS